MILSETKSSHMLPMWNSFIFAKKTTYDLQNATITWSTFPFLLW